MDNINLSAAQKAAIQRDIFQRTKVMIDVEDPYKAAKAANVAAQERMQRAVTDRQLAAQRVADAAASEKAKAGNG